MKRIITILIVIALIFSVFALIACERTDNVYTVTFDSRGGSEVSTQILEKGEKATRPFTPTKVGDEFVTYNFLGWYLNGDLYDFDSEISSNITLIAVWEEVVWSQDIENRD